MPEALEPVVNIADVETFPLTHGEAFAALLGPIGARIGLEQLGCMVTVVEPGKRAFPFHVHHGMEEMFVILDGEGTYRFGPDRYPIKAGDVLAAPAGGPEKAHQIINTGSRTLRYLGISTKADPEVVEYPDSDKFTVFSQTPDGTPMSARLRFVGRTDTSLDYWDGEDA